MANQLYNKNGKDAFHILICLIQVWDPNDGFMTPPKNCLEIAEVESIEISDNYKQLINKAKVKFPRGTVIRKTSKTVEAVLEDAKKVTASMDEHGVLLTTRKSYSEVASVNDFSVGKRIRIYLGYTTDPEIAGLPKFNSVRGSIFTNSDLHERYLNAIRSGKYYYGPLFDGYITRCSIDTPIELECEDLASVLKQYNAPNVPKGTNLTVNDLLTSDGKYKDKYNMLKNTNFQLYPQTKDCVIDIGPATFNSDLTVADVLTTWTKMKLYSYVWIDYSLRKSKEPVPYIVVGRSYFTNRGKDSIITQREENGYPEEYLIDFNYNVADNGLTLTESNKKFLCIQGQSLEKNGKFYHMTIRQNPEWKTGDPAKDRWQILNEITISKKMQRMGATVMSKSGNKKQDLSKYTVVPYVSRKIGVTHEELLQELIKYYEDFNMTGIEGSLTLFGDLQLQSGAKVRLFDPYYPAKNGLYFIDEVTTKFGVGGFRQTIKLPYCIKRDSNEDKDDK